MLSITEWWAVMTAVDKMFWSIALFSTVFFLLQTAATLIGLSGSDGADMDAPSDAIIDGSDGMMDLFTLRNMVNFLLGFGWSGVCLHSVIGSTGLLVVVSLLIGCAFVALFVFVYKQMMRLEKHGNVDFSDAVGTTQTVYLRIPAQMTGRGKVQLSLNGSVFEVEALTQGDAIASGQKVKIVGMEGSSAFIVEKI